MNRSAAPDLDLTDRSIYQDWVRVTIRFSDQDTMGHVNNTAYAVWFEVSRVPFLTRFTELAEELDVVLARMCIDFRRETYFPGEVEVGARLNRLGNKSIHSVYGIFRDGECLATAECVNVFFDTATRRSMEPPLHVRAAVLAAIAHSNSAS